MLGIGTILLMMSYYNNPMIHQPQIFAIEYIEQGITVYSFWMHFHAMGFCCMTISWLHEPLMNAMDNYYKYLCKKKIKKVLKI